LLAGSRLELQTAEYGASGFSIPGGTSQFAKFETNRVHYISAGKGTNVIVFVHGWSGNAGFWKEQVPALAQKARLLLVDLPGHGRSEKPRVDYTMDFFARGVLAVMREARADKAALVGHSMGVPVICRVHAQAPDKVAALVAVDGLLRRPQLKPEDVERFTAPFERPDYRAHVTNFIYSMFTDSATYPLRDQVLREVIVTPHHVMASAMNNMFNAVQPAWDPKNVTVPVLVLNAPNPRWTSEYESYARALSPATDYRVIEGTGHCLMLEAPAKFNEALVSILKSHKLIAE